MRRPPRTEPAPLGRPLFLLNLKSYPAAVGDRAQRIGRLLVREAAGRGVPCALAPSAFDLGRLAARLEVPVLAQHVDALEPGPTTGRLVPAAAAAAGAKGSLVNHSERPLDLRVIDATLGRLAECGLTAVVCARDVRQARDIARRRPRYLAIEPPELIGGTVSVSAARPEVITGTVDAVRRLSPRTIVLCGAGIRNRRDVERAIELGAEGVLVSSAVAAAPSPRSALRELLSGYPAR